MNNVLSKQQTDNFINHGYIRIDDAFSKTTADAVVDILWNDIPFDRNSPNTWTEPVVRLGMYSQNPFTDSVNTPLLYKIFDELVGPDRWLPCRSVGTFPVRFPSNKEPNDTGMHVDVSFPGAEPANYFEWRSNIYSKGRALLMLVLYSDVAETDAPTLLLEGSHLHVARMLQPNGDEGLSFMEIANRLDTLPVPPVVKATGNAGAIYLCHPFMVHAAQAHYGRTPKFMAQPPLLLRGRFEVYSTNNPMPVELAIQKALSI